MNWFQKFYWRKLSKPAGDRSLWAYLLENPIGSILQLGVSDGVQTQTILKLARKGDQFAVMRFAAIDLFESAADSSRHMRLKDAHRMCAEAGVKAHLIPGELKSALPRAAVTILPSDLVVVNSTCEENGADAVAVNTWLPRLIHPQSVVFQRSALNGKLEVLEIASTCQVRHAA